MLRWYYDVLTMQKFPPDGDYEWQLEDSEFVPILAEDLTAPLELIELSVCSCNSDSTSRRYKYNKNVLIYTDMCKCLYCNNNAAESNIVAPQDIEIDDFDYSISSSSSNS